MTQWLPYIPSKKLKIVSLATMGLSLLAIVAILASYQMSGTVAATAATTKPVSQMDLTGQYGMAKIQQMARNAMIDKQLPTMSVDLVENLDVEFNPVHIAPTMGEVALILEVTENGFTPPSPGSAHYGNQFYELHNVATKTRVWTAKVDQTTLNGVQHDGVYASQDFTDKKQSATLHHGRRQIMVGRISGLPEGDYSLHAVIQKRKFASPIDKIDLVLKTGMAPEPEFAHLALLMAVVFVAMVGVIMTTPPDQRHAKPKSAR